jgi:hypothetical protein
MGLPLQHLLQHTDEEDMLNRIVTGDESRAHHYTMLNQSALQCNGNIPVHLQPKSYAIS